MGGVEKGACQAIFYRNNPTLIRDILAWVKQFLVDSIIFSKKVFFVILVLERVKEKNIFH